MKATSHGDTRHPWAEGARRRRGPSPRPRRPFQLQMLRLHHRKPQSDDAEHNQACPAGAATVAAGRRAAPRADPAPRGSAPAAPRAVAAASEAPSPAADASPATVAVARAMPPSTKPCPAGAATVVAGGARRRGPPSAPRVSAPSARGPSPPRPRRPSQLQMPRRPGDAAEHQTMPSRRGDRLGRRRAAPSADPAPRAGAPARAGTPPPPGGLLLAAGRGRGPPKR
jgi:hypothetical protein